MTSRGPQKSKKTTHPRRGSKASTGPKCSQPTIDSHPQEPIPQEPLRVEGRFWEATELQLDRLELTNQGALIAALLRDQSPERAVACAVRAVLNGLTVDDARALKSGESI